jgi:response regulator NasT
VLIDIENPSRNVPEELTLATGPLERPVALFVGRSGDGMTRAAIEAGVSAYVVDGMRPERIKPVMDAAIARFRPFRRMRTELDAAKQAL